MLDLELGCHWPEGEELCYLTLFSISLRESERPLAGGVRPCATVPPRTVQNSEKQHNQRRQLKNEMHVNTGERNALHLQNKTACRDGGGKRGLQETRRGDEFNPKRQITRSTLHCLSLELQSATHGGRE